jgi:hypothetical protein
MAVAGRARAARKYQIVREVGYLLRLVDVALRRSQVSASGDRLVRSAATGWSGQRRPIGRLAVPLPHPYQIVSPCRLAGAPSTRGSPTRCTPG